MDGGKTIVGWYDSYTFEAEMTPTLAKLRCSAYLGPQGCRGLRAQGRLLPSPSRVTGSSSMVLKVEMAVKFSVNEVIPKK